MGSRTAHESTCLAADSHSLPTPCTADMGMEYCAGGELYEQIKRVSSTGTVLQRTACIHKSSCCTVPHTCHTGVLGKAAAGQHLSRRRLSVSTVKQ